MQEVVVVGAARTPFGLYRGELADQRSQDLAANSMKEAVVRAGVDSAKFDASIYSESIQTSLPANVARHGWLLAGFSEDPAGFTMNTLCAGALQTMFSAYNKLVSGEYKVFMTGGVGTNSQAPYYIFHPRYEFGAQSMCFHDQKLEIQTNAQPVEQYGELTITALADIISSNYGLSRLQLDEYTADSKAKAVASLKNGSFKDAIVPIVKKVKKAEVSVDTDEGLKKTVSLEELMAMPAINCCGNASEGNVAAMADGAAGIVMMSADSAQELGATSLAKVAGFGIAAGNPTLIERTTLKSIEKALKFAGISLNEVDYIDLHEQSAAYALAVSNLLGADAAAKINVDGGSLAFGHAGAATGGAMVVNMIYRLLRTGAKIGLVNVGSLGGQSLSIVIKR